MTADGLVVTAGFALAIDDLRNGKVTTAEDLELAAAILARRSA